MPNDKIPDDIMAAAREAVAQEWCFCPELAEEVRAGLKDDSITICSTIRAIAAERERCAAIAERFCESWPLLSESDHIQGKHYAATRIAAEIRSGV